MSQVGSLSRGHRQAIEELRRVEAAKPGAITVTHVPDAPDARGWLAVELSLDCAHTPTGPDGIELEAREEVDVHVPADFPFRPPSAWVRHDRFAGVPHVQWRRHICLYQADADWDASDGMIGFTTQLATWYLRAAAGTLDEPGQPLHPPVAYASRLAGCVVVHANAPRPGQGGDAAPWLGSAVLRQVHDDRCDVIDWLELDEALPPDAGAFNALVERLEILQRQPPGQPVFLAPAIILPTPMSFEFPDKVATLVDALTTRGVKPATLITLLGDIALLNGLLAGPPPTGADAAAAATYLFPLYAFIGSPMRGTAAHEDRQTHLAAWRLDEADAALAPRLVEIWASDDPTLTAATSDVTDLVEAWIADAPTSWATLYEQRPEIVTRRDAGRPASWLQDRRVLVLGCGALGAPIAEHCLRAGAFTLILADRELVDPGILVRQPYTDDDIGEPKVDALARRLLAIKPDATIIREFGDVTARVLSESSDPPMVDLVVDATASQTVSAKLERCRWTSNAAWPPVLTVGIGHESERGVACLALPTSSGAGSDILRRVGLEARSEAHLADVADDLFPNPPRAERFQPEPGCSEPTFVGSAAEVGALAAQLLTCALGALRAHATGERVAPMSAWAVRLPIHPQAKTPAPDYMSWPNDTVVDDVASGYQVRFAPRAMEAMRAEAQVTGQLHGLHVETGGVLLGQVDDACRVAWVSTAEGPPPDSELSPRHFQLGTDGVKECIAAYRTASAGKVHFVGVWHTHPGGSALPSPTDQRAMATLLVPVDQAPPRALLVVVGGWPTRWRGWLRGIGSPRILARLVSRTAAMPARSPLAIPGPRASVDPATSEAASSTG